MNGKMMNKQRIGVSLVLVTALSLFVLAIAATPVSAQPPPHATVSIDDVTVPQYATATIPIMITEATENVSSAHINLTYDPTVVQVTAVGGSPFDNFDYNIINGEVKMIGFQSAGSLQAPLKFADVTVKAIGNPGNCTPLNLEGTVYQGHGSPYGETEFNNGSVCIVTAVPVYNTVGMIALIGLLAIVLAVTVRRR